MTPIYNQFILQTADIVSQSQLLVTKCTTDCQWFSSDFLLFGTDQANKASPAFASTLTTTGTTVDPLGFILTPTS